MNARSLVIALSLGLTIPATQSRAIPTPDCFERSALLRSAELYVRDLGYRPGVVVHRKIDGKEAVVVDDFFTTDIDVVIQVPAGEYFIQPAFAGGFGRILVNGRETQFLLANWKRVR